jgi:hypothetical protein
MSGPPVVLTTNARPVTNVISERGAVPMVVVSTLGEPITLVASGGEPVTLLNPNGTLWDFPFSLFASGAQGAWYDPSDFSTLYQNSTGTTPVTAVEQSVGLMLDRSRGGAGTNGAFRRNLLTYSEQFDNAVWIKANTGAASIPTVTANAGTAPDGTATADRVQYSLGGGTASGDISNFYQTNATTGALTHSIYLKSFDGVSSYNMQITDSAGAGQPITVTGAWQRFAVSATSAGSTNYAIRLRGGATPTNSNTADVLIWGAQLETGSTATAYQPITASWADTMAGTHALQATSASRPVLRARYNLLTYSEQFDNAASAWTSANGAVTANQTVAPDGATTADVFLETAITNVHQIYRSITLTTGVHTWSVYLKPNGRTLCWLNAHDGTDNRTWFDLSGSGSVLTSAAGNTAAITALTGGWYRISISRTAASTSGFHAFGTATADNVTFTIGDITKGFYCWGAQLLTAADQTSTGGAYQRIAAATDYDTSNPVWRPYLAFDGTDDNMSTASIDFSANDEMTVFAGVTKLSDAAVACVMSYNGTSNASAEMFAPRNTSTNGDFAFTHRTTTVQEVGSGIPVLSPVTAVLTGISDISAPFLELRRNGAVIQTNTTALAANNYTSGTIRIGHRNGNFFFNGRLYSLAVLGRTATTEELTAMETWVNGKTGGY